MNLRPIDHLLHRHAGNPASPTIGPRAERSHVAAGAGSVHEDHGVLDPREGAGPVPWVDCGVPVNLFQPGLMG